MKSNRGITLTMLAITIVIMIIITGTITFNISIASKTQSLDNFYSDLKLLKEKVDLYYFKYGKLPVTREYTDISNIPTSELNPNDNEKYYIINLTEMENITVRLQGTIYVINEETHTIYIPDGVTIEGVTFYRLPEQYTEISL